MTASPQESEDSGVRLYTASAFEYRKSKSIYYRAYVSRDELLNDLYDVLPRADVISIRRVSDDRGYRPPSQEEIVEAEYGTAPPATEKQLRLMERVSIEKDVPLPEGFPNIPKRQASEWLDKALKKSKDEGNKGGARA